MKFRWVAIHYKGMTRSIAGIGAICLAAIATAAESDPLILFQEKQADAIVYGWFDTADPGMAAPVEIARMPVGEKLRTLGVYNGVLYTVGESGALGAINLATGEDLQLNFNLPKRHIQEGAIVFLPPGDEGAREGQVLDLRGPMLRTISLPEGDSASRRVSANGMRYLYYTIAPPQPDDPSETLKLEFSMLDLLQVDSEPTRFRVTVRRRWEVEPPSQFSPDATGPEYLVLRPSEQFQPLSFTWLTPDRFAFVALSVEFEGIAWEGESDGGSALFVMDLAARTGRIQPLSAVPLQGPARPSKGQPDSNSYALDAHTLTPWDGSATAQASTLDVLSEHFSFSRESMKVLHRNQPIEWMKVANQHTDIDESGERILVRMEKTGACYDIYEGFYAECAPFAYLRFIERDAILRREHSVPEGWTSLLPTPLNPSEETAPSARRLNRAVEYTLAATSDKSAYAEGQTVSIQVTLTNTGAEARWTDAPTADYPILTGTLAGPAYAVTISNIAKLKPMPPTAPTFLEPGGTLTGTLEFVPEAPGAYTMALAYGGNPESDWMGRAKAPLIRFTVGDATTDDNARLRFAIQDFIDRRGKMQDKLFDELRAAGDAGEDLLIEMLKDLPKSLEPGQPILEGDSHEYRSTISTLYGYLRDRRSPRLVPFFVSLLESDNSDMKHDGLFGIQELHKRSNDTEFKTQLEGILRDAYADDELISKARTDKDFDFRLFPELYDELTALAEGEDPVKRLEALEVLAEVYLWRQDTYSGDLEKFVAAMLADDAANMSVKASHCVGRFYKRGRDLPNAQRVIDDYRLRYPERFDDDFLDNQNELWDMAWLRRAAEDPTEARFNLLQRSLEAIEAHTGIKRADSFPAAWTDLQSSETARAAFADTLKAWADFIQTSPAPFRIPALKR